MNQLIQYIIQFFDALYTLGLEMAPYLLLGFLFAGILKVYFPNHLIYKTMGKNNTRSVINAAILGVPLPLCSCGVIPTGISLNQNGASKGATVSFLISTPQTGVDSILVTWSLLGLPFAIIRPIVAFTTGIFGGIATNIFNKKAKLNTKQSDIHDEFKGIGFGKKIIIALRYGFVDFMQDIVKWLVIGLLIAAAIEVILPADFFEKAIGNQWLEMLLVLVAAVPLYVCATGSVPIAAILLMKGLSPGAALIFLMAGPATNAATITVIYKSLGKKTAIIYLSSIILGAYLFGILINNFLPSSWFTIMHNHAHNHQHNTHGIFEIISLLLLSSLILYSFYIKYFKSKTIQKTMNDIEIQVEGMTCNHCSANVEKGLKSISGITNAVVDLQTKKVIVSGENISLKELENKINDLGYSFVKKNNL